jgi:uncharacterized protein DUF2442
MRNAPIAEKDRAVGVRDRPEWHVVDVRAKPGFKLDVTFADGLRGTVDLQALIHGEAAGIFSSLRDVQRFEAVAIEFGAVTWPGDIDLAPDAMHAEIRKSGEWIVS